VRKQYLILETTQFDRPPAPQVRPDRIAVREREVLARGAGGGAIAQPQPAHQFDQERFIDWNEVHVVMCYSMHDAEEYVEDILARNPQYKYIIFESAAFLETVASPTVRKMWDANGQLVETR
jgi:hypothetical protein